MDKKTNDSLTKYVCISCFVNCVPVCCDMDFICGRSLLFNSDAENRQMAKDWKFGVEGEEWHLMLVGTITPRKKKRPIFRRKLNNRYFKKIRIHAIRKRPMDMLVSLR